MRENTWTGTHGLLCFSADWRDPVIWAHYSDKHRGFCLGFEIPDNVATKVRYVDQRLRLPETPTLEHATAWVYTKFTNWAYEQEIRCVVSLEERSGDFYFMNFGETLKLVAVIAGAQCTVTRQKILEALGPSNTGVEVIKARAGFQRFEVVEDQRGFRK